MPTEVGIHVFLAEPRHRRITVVAMTGAAGL
jgi:hypothetical protein